MPDQQQRSTPSRHVDRSVARRPPGPLYDRGTGALLPQIPSLAEAEALLYAHDIRLTELVEDYAALNEAAAIAKADWEEHRDRTILHITNTGEKTAVDQRAAQAKLAMSARGTPGEDLYRAHLITEAAATSAGRQLTAVQSQLSSVQTLVNGLRKVSGVT